MVKLGFTQNKTVLKKFKIKSTYNKTSMQIVKT